MIPLLTCQPLNVLTRYLRVLLSQLKLHRTASYLTDHNLQQSKHPGHAIIPSKVVRSMKLLDYGLKKNSASTRANQIRNSLKNNLTTKGKYLFMVSLVNDLMIAFQNEGGLTKSKAWTRNDSRTWLVVQFSLVLRKPGNLVYFCLVCLRFSWRGILRSYAPKSMARNNQVINESVLPCDHRPQLHRRK